MNFKEPKLLQFLGHECEVELGIYPNGRIAIGLVKTEDREPMLIASVNLPYEFIDENEVAIKNYSENEGVLDVLIEAQVISAPIRFAKSGYIQAPICKLIYA